MSIPNSHFVGWTAIIGGVVGVIGFVSLILLFVVGEPFGTLNDILSIPTAFLLLPLVVALYRLNAAEQSWLSLFALIAGLTGFISTAVGSVLLVSGRIDFDQSLIYGIGGFGLIGLWALLNSVMGLSEHALPQSIGLDGHPVGRDAHAGAVGCLPGEQRRECTEWHGWADSGRRTNQPDGVCPVHVGFYQLCRAAHLVHPDRPGFSYRIGALISVTSAAG